MYLYYAPVYAKIEDVVETARRCTAMAVYVCAMSLMAASLGPVGTALLSDRLASRAAAAAGSPIVSEAFRAQGLYQAMYVVPALSVVLAVVLFTGARASVRDPRQLISWMRPAPAS